MAHLSISKAWDEAVAFVGEEGALLFPVAFIFMALPAVVLSQVMPQTDLSSAKSVAEMMALIRPNLPVMAGSFVITTLFGLFGSLTLYALSLGAGISVGEALRVAFRCFVPALAAGIILLGTSLVMALPLGLMEAGAVLAGSLMFLIALPILMVILIRLTVVNAVIVQEHRGALAAIARGWALTKGQFWKIFGFIFIMGLVLWVASLAASAIFGILDALIGQDDRGGILSMLASAVVDTVFGVYVLVTTTRIYRQLSTG